MRINYSKVYSSTELYDPHPSYVKNKECKCKG